jgi:Asp-tRNA(Asn)/Glu-tRNA(Gln) amidotransferase A subunit family amidase
VGAGQRWHRHRSGGEPFNGVGYLKMRVRGGGPAAPVTGLPRMTIRAGFFGGRLPFGLSFVGRLWADPAQACEQATCHRRPLPGGR